MIRMLARTTALALAMAFAVTHLPAAAYGQDQPIYGSQLMTEQERTEYRGRLQTAQTQEEREQIRLEHHRQMQERANAMGIELPDEPPAMGMGGQRMGSPQGAGSGAGMGGAGGGRGGRGG